MGKRERTVARCGECGHEEPRWVGRCPACESWGSLVEMRAAPTTAGPRAAGMTAAALPIGQVPLDGVRRTSTGISEFDRVLGGGLVPGAVALVGGEPGIGKSTLLLQASHAVAVAGGTVLYVSAEESAGQVRLRAERLGALAPTLLVAAETALPSVLDLIDRHRPDVVVLDSIQTLSDPQLGSAAGSVVQVRECAAALTRLAKVRGTAVLLVGHVTKDGAIAGPRVLEHLVDVVLSFEGDRHHALRLLRGLKNRFGPAGEVGCFEMAGDGLREVIDTTRLFTAAHDDATPGVALTVMIEGPRPLVVEVQALAAKSNLTMPRRVATGLDASRLPLLVAVLDKRANVVLREHDLFASAVGGVRVREPAADLAVCLAIASSLCDVPVPQRTVAIGEVGLAGEVRPVPQLERRLSEAARSGFTSAIVPAAFTGEASGLRLVRVADLASAVRTITVRAAAVPG